MPTIIADDYVKHICEVLGLPFDRTTRLIIDAKVGSAVMVYHESLGDEGMLTFAPRRLTDIEISEEAS